MKKNIIIISSIILAAILIQILLSNSTVFENLELMSYDLRSKIYSDHFHHPNANKEIVIVAIDDYSKRKIMENPPEDLGPMPWHRDAWNSIVDFIEQGEPKAVLFDMVFENLNENTWHDRRFAQDLRKYDNIVLGTYLDEPKVKNDTFAKQINVSFSFGR